MRKTPYILVIIAFLANTFSPIPWAQAQEFRLPAPGVRVGLSPDFSPSILKGIKVHPDNPFHFDFILDQGDSSFSSIEATKLIKYFLASLTIPEKDLWVNLSPYEKNRIVPESFGQTEMGRDLLAEDYMLKQITASLIYPEGETGRKFWERIYEEAAKKFGTTNIPVNTFNKVWIVPEKAVVYENAKAGTAYVVESKLKVMLEQDYLSMQKHMAVRNDMASLGANIVREIVIPELTKEINEDKNFSQLRQVFNSLILATWYKKKIRDSILAQVYADKKKIAGVGYKSSINVGLIYQRYLQAFKKGVYNYIKEEIDPATQEIIPRKYFSGGVDWAMFGNEVNKELQFTSDPAMLPSNPDKDLILRIEVNSFNSDSRAHLAAMVEKPLEQGKSQAAERKTLDGLTILRFSHNMELNGGQQLHITNLDNFLLQRNAVTIIEVFYTEDQNLKRSDTSVGKGRLIRIPIFFGSGTTGGENLIKASIVQFLKQQGLDYKVRRLLALKSARWVFGKMPVVRKYYQPRLSERQFQDRLMQILTEYKVDLIVNHSPGLLNEGLAINNEGAFNHIPVVIQNHGTNRFLSITGAPMNILAQQAGHIVTVASSDIPAGLQGKTTILSNGIDTDFFDPHLVSAEAETDLKQRLNIQPTDKVVLFSARVEPNKGQLDAIDILLKSRQRGERYKLFFVGVSNDRRFLDQIKRKINNVHLDQDIVIAGHFSQVDLRTMYQISDLVILPSTSEGKPRVLLEAEAMGKPVVAYANDGIREVVNDGQTGYLVASKDYDNFARRIEALLKDGNKRKQMGENGRQFILLRFTLPSLAERHEQFYISVLKKKEDSAQLAPDQAMPGNIELKNVNLRAANVNLTDQQRQEIVYAYLAAKGENPLPADQLDVQYLGQGSYNIVLGYGNSALRVNKGIGGNLTHDRFYFTLLKHLGIGPGILAYTTLSINGKPHYILEVERFPQGSREQRHEVLNDQEIIQIQKLLDTLIENRIYIEDFKLENIALEDGKAYVLDVDTAKEYYKPFEPQGKELAEMYVHIINSAKNRNWAQWTSYDPQGRIIKHLQDKAMTADEKRLKGFKAGSQNEWRLIDAQQQKVISNEGRIQNALDLNRSNLLKGGDFYGLTAFLNRSLEFVKYVKNVQDVVAGVLGDGKDLAAGRAGVAAAGNYDAVVTPHALYTNEKTFHATLDSNVVKDRSEIDDAAKELKQDTADLNEMGLTALGPHLMPNLGITIELDTDDPQLIKIKDRTVEHASQRDPQAASNKIIYVSVAYIHGATADQIREISQKLQGLRQVPPDLKLNVDALNIATGTLGRKTVQDKGPSVQLQRRDSAQLTKVPANTGGIDLTHANMNLQTQNNNGEIKFHLDPAMLEQLRNAAGFVPVIINVQPLNNLKSFLGVDDIVNQT